MILHIIPTVTHDYTRDYVMLVPTEPDQHPLNALDYLEERQLTPAVVERDIVFAGLSAFRRMYADIKVHTRPM